MSEKPANKQNPPKSIQLKRWIAGTAAAMVLLGAGAAGGYLLGSESNPPEEVGNAEAPVPSQKENFVEAPSKLGPMIDIESFIVNILDEQGVRYLKAAITLEADNQKTATELDQRLPQIRDAILLLVGNKTFGELSDLQGKLQLRADLINRLNEILQTGTIRKIYFTEFVVQ